MYGRCAKRRVHFLAQTCTFEPADRWRRVNALSRVGGAQPLCTFLYSLCTIYHTRRTAGTIERDDRLGFASVVPSFSLFRPGRRYYYYSDDGDYTNRGPGRPYPRRPRYEYNVHAKRNVYYNNNGLERIDSNRRLPGKRSDCSATRIKGLPRCIYIYRLIDMHTHVHAIKIMCATVVDPWAVYGYGRIADRLVRYGRDTVRSWIRARLHYET